MNRDICGSLCPSFLSAYRSSQAELICESFLYWFGRPLVRSSGCLGEALFEASTAIVSHGIGLNPIFNYGNRMALSVFKMDWADFVALPSEESAEPLARSERLKLLSLVERNGFVEGYSGVRIDSAGRRFRIVNGTVWNLVNQEDDFMGQAACFDNWEEI